MYINVTRDMGIYLNIKYILLCVKDFWFAEMNEYFFKKKKKKLQKWKDVN